MEAQVTYVPASPCETVFDNVDLGPLICHTSCVSIVRTHIILPEDLVREIDELVGPRGRSAFIVETARDAVRRKRLLEFLTREEPIWENEDHPELAAGSARWVRKVRAQTERSSQSRRKRKR